MGHPLLGTFGGVLKVSICQHGLGCSVAQALTCYCVVCTNGCAVAPSVVGRGQAPAVVVAKFDDDNRQVGGRRQDGCDCREAAFVGVGAS